MSRFSLPIRVRLALGFALLMALVLGASRTRIGREIRLTARASSGSRLP